MTIPAGFIWCPTCHDACHDHSRICTVCGSTLVHPPDNVVHNNNNNRRNRNQQQPSMHAVVPDHLLEQLRTGATALQQMVRQLHTNIEQAQQDQRTIMEELRHMREDWTTTTTTAEQDNAGRRRGRRPTARATLEALPRILLENNAHSFFRQASLSFVSSTITTTTASTDGSNTTTHRVTNGLETMQAIPGEFGSAKASISFDQAVLVVAEPRTGAGGALSTETRQTIQALTTATTTTTVAAADRNDSNNETTTTTTAASATNVDVILYMERGGGVTFVQKAVLAQQAGAKALVIGNNQAQPWPFVMRDSNHEADANHLTIPVVMVKQADGQAILSKCHRDRTCSQVQQKQQQQQQETAVACALSIQPQSKECVICTETFQVGHTVLQIPACGHVFHEACALQWLEHHNTCPYCRRELPTDDPEYEQERRRAQRTHAGSEGGTTQQQSSSWNDFYG